MKINCRNMYLVLAAYKVGWGVGYMSGRIRKLF
jgi:hypothetical protein